jgi:hypothetical protein
MPTSCSPSRWRKPITSEFKLAPMRPGLPGAERTCRWSRQQGSRQPLVHWDRPIANVSANSAEWQRPEMSGEMSPSVGDPPRASYRCSAVDRCPEFGQAISIQRVPDPLATTVPLYETGISEDLQVM